MRRKGLPQVFLARDQGKSPPRLHKARLEVTRIPPIRILIVFIKVTPFHLIKF